MLCLPHFEHIRQKFISRLSHRPSDRACKEFANATACPDRVRCAYAGDACHQCGPWAKHWAIYTMEPLMSRWVEHLVHRCQQKGQFIKWVSDARLQLIERDGKPSKLRRRDPDLKKLIKSDMVFLEESPDYCERNDEYVLHAPPFHILINAYR